MAALALGRGVRFTIVAGLGAIYGRHIVRFFSRYYMPALFTLIALAVIAGVLSHSVLSLQEQDGHGLGSVFLSAAGSFARD